jgi:hypothetical protein
MAHDPLNAEVFDPFEEKVSLFSFLTQDVIRKCLEKKREYLVY